MVLTLSKEALHTPDQYLLHVLKAFENALESQLKYTTGEELERIFVFVSNSDVVESATFKTKTWLKLQD